MKATKRGKQPPPENDRVFLTHPAFAADRKASALRQMESPLRRHALWVQLGAFIAVLLIWQLPIVNPVKLLVVLFHELSHCVAAVATGGTVFGIAVDLGGAGVTLGMGGDRGATLLAGYTGSLAVGALLMMITAVWEPREVWGVLLLISGASLLFGWLTDISEVFGYGTVFAVLICLCLREEFQKFVLRMVATASCLYPVIDVAAEIVRRSTDGFTVGDRVVGSDVAELATLTGIPPIVIGTIWTLLGLSAVAILVAWSTRKEAEVTVRRSLFRRHKARQGLEHPLYDPTRPDSVPEYTIR